MRWTQTTQRVALFSVAASTSLKQLYNPELGYPKVEYCGYPARGLQLGFSFPQVGCPIPSTRHLSSVEEVKHD
jgi:hypothetical protein